MTIRPVCLASHFPVNRSAFWLVTVLLFIFETASAQHDSLLVELNKTLQNKPAFVEQKLSRINHYRSQIEKLPEQKGSKYFWFLDKLSEEYKTFIYDSAFPYTLKFQRAAYELNDPVKIVHARVKLGFMLISSGMFKETLDSLSTLRVTDMPDGIRFNYYFILARTYYDLGDFDRDVYSTPRYNALGNKYIDSARRFAEARFL